MKTRNGMDSKKIKEYVYATYILDYIMEEYAPETITWNERRNLFLLEYKDRPRRTLTAKKVMFEMKEAGKLTESKTGNVGADDGPTFLYPSISVYQKNSKKRAEKLGFTVTNVHTGGATDEDTSATLYNDPVDSVSFFPAGVIGKLTPMNRSDLFSSSAWDKWFEFVNRATKSLGWTTVTTFRDRAMRSQTGKDASSNLTIKQSNTE